MADNDLLTTAEAAAALGLTVQGVISAIKRDQLTATKFGNERTGMWQIARSEVERYARERRPAHRPPKE